MKLRERKITVRLTDAERGHLLEQAELAGLRRQLAAIGNNINQITKRVNSGEPVTEETLRLIADMQSQIWEKLKAF